MRITQKQLMMLFQTLKDTLVFHERKENNPFSFNHAIRIELVETILNQQSNLLVEIEE